MTIGKKDLLLYAVTDQTWTGKLSLYEQVQQAIEEAQQDAAPPVEEVSAPEEEQPAAVQEPEETQPAVYEVKFAVRGTIEQLKKLKQFIMQEGMSYDDI